MSEVRPSYQYGQSSPPEAQPLVHPAGKALLPLVSMAMVAASLLLLFAVRLPLAGGFAGLLALFLCATLLLFAAVAFGVWLMSVVLLQHALWVEDRRQRSARENLPTT